MLGSFVKEAQAKVASGVAMQPGYSMTWGGGFREPGARDGEAEIVLPLALALTFVLLFSAFGSVFDATVILAEHAPPRAHRRDLRARGHA